MMTKEEELLHLNNIAIEIDQIAGYTEAMDYENFTSSEGVQETVYRSLKNIGQAAEMLKSVDNWESRYPELDLNVLSQLSAAPAEASLEMDQHSLWGIVSKDLSKIKIQVFEAQEKIERQEEGGKDLQF